MAKERRVLGGKDKPFFDQLVEKRNRRKKGRVRWCADERREKKKKIKSKK